MRIYFILATFLFYFYSATANDDFTSFMDEITEIATKTKLNIDYQPSVVSVLRADKLKRIGITNLHEALGLLPGIETSILHTGWKQVIIRGNYSPDSFAFDKYKLYIDGVDVGSDLYSTSYFYLDFPIELIDRIEVLRGSASTIYGPGALSGAINVITLSSKINYKDGMFATIGSYDYIKGGFVQHFNVSDWNIGVDAYYQRNNKTIYAGPSFVSDPNYMRSDYDSLENFKDFSIGSVAQNEDFKFIVRYKSEVTDNFYGMDESLEPVKGGYQRNESTIVEIQHKYDINNDLSLETKVGINHYSFTFDTVLMKDIMSINPTYKQLNSYLSVSLQGDNFKNNNWMIGVNVKKINTLENTLGSNSAFEISDADKFLDGDHDQIIKSLYFQDIYALTDDFDISANIRLDDYSIFKEMFSYRFGSVYRIDDNNILKAIYGRSYRTPSYIEAFQAKISQFKDGNPNLEPEYMDTYELAYTYKNNNSILRTNIYYSSIKNVIDSVIHEPSTFVGDYMNHRQRDAKGLELEFTHQFENGSEFMANFSYVKTKYFTTEYYTPVEYQSPEISEILSKGYFLYPLMQELSFNTSWYYSGPKKGFDPDNTGNTQAFDSTILIDETIAYDIDNFSSVTFSLKNLFDETIKYPSFVQYHESITREGRNWLLTYSKQF